MEFTKKAIVQSGFEWKELYMRSCGWENFPYRWYGGYPVLVLASGNQNCGMAYIFISADDIKELLK